MSRKILLADDSLTIQKVVELTFMEGDFEVTAVSNGDDALTQLAEMSPDVVIADVHMPGADGFQICRATKESHPTAPVLLLVGTFEPFEESSAAACGADAHLKKPFDSQELLRLVEELLAQRAARGEEPAAEIARESEFENEVFEDTSFAETLSEPDLLVDVQPPDDMEGEDTSLAFTEEVAVEDRLEATPAALSDEDVDRIARRVVELIGDQTIREISWDVIPDLAEIVIKDRIRELESQVD
jgi:DNA-binding response OmpR family regulator